MLAQHHIEACLVWQRALLKFAYIFGKTTLTLAQEGFCRPSETDDSSTEANNFEGTGMGSGEGTKNVSNEIENQEQVEGLQDENDQDSPADDDDTKDGKDDMLDLEDDFGGTTQDVQEQDEENKEEGSKDGDDDEEEDVDEELGKVDPLDPTAVDDKFWEDKEDSRDENRSPEPEEQSGQKAGKDDSADVGERQEQSEHTKADDGDETAAEKDEPDSKPPPDDGGAEEDGPETSAEGEEAPETEQGPRQELPEMDLDEQTLDLPDDLELDLPHEEEAEDDEIDAELQADAIGEFDQSQPLTVPLMQCLSQTKPSPPMMTLSTIITVKKIRRSRAMQIWNRMLSSKKI